MVAVNCWVLVREFAKFGAMNSLTRILCALTLLLLAACDFSFSKFSFGKDDPVIVSVGSTKLTQSMVRKLVPQWDSLDDRGKLAFLEHWMDEEVIYQEAMDAKILNDSVLNSQIESTVRKMVVDYFLQTFADTMMVGDAEKLNYYQDTRMPISVARLPFRGRCCVFPRGRTPMPTTAK